MNIAKIVVAAAVYAIDKPYDYLVPPALEEKCVPGFGWRFPSARAIDGVRAWCWR